MKDQRRPSKGAARAGGSRGADSPLAPGKRTLTQRLVQRKKPQSSRHPKPTFGSAEGDEAFAIQSHAAEGVAGTGSSLPHLDAIQAAFGRHDVSEVEAHVGGAAADAADAIGAEAYATGNHVAFAGAPDLHTAAHEAAHIVQQRSGVQLKGGVGEVGDAYEQHADAVADAVVQGKPAEALLDRSPGGGTPRGVQAKEGGDKKRAELFTVNNREDNLLTGLPDHLEGPVDTLVQDVRKLLGGWAKQRTTAELQFTDNMAVIKAFSKFRRSLRLEPLADLMKAHAAAARRLDSGTTPQFVQEIRAFNKGALADVQNLLGVDDVDCEHSYSIAAVSEGSFSVGKGGASVGKSSRVLEIHYRNEPFGITWKQRVSLSGFKLGIGISLNLGGEFGAEEITDNEIPTFEGSFNIPFDDAAATPAELKPAHAYLPPSFFEVARFTAASASVKAKASAGGAALSANLAETSALVIGDGQRSLTWPNKSWIFGDGVDAVDLELDPKAMVQRGPPGAEAGAGFEIGEWSGERMGDVELEGGLGELDEKSNYTYRWTPLHLVRIYFETGSTEVTDRDAGTLIKLVQAMTKRRFKDGGEIPPEDLVRKGTYRIEVSGHYSNCWDQHDKELQQIEAREAAGKSRRSDEHRKDVLLALKRAENEGLAMTRAFNVQETLKDIVTFESEFVEYKTRIKHMLGKTPVLEPPVDTDPYANNPNDRRVEVRVSALLGYPQG